jgi:hypothetical protein
MEELLGCLVEIYIKRKKKVSRELYGKEERFDLHIRTKLGHSIIYPWLAPAADS